MYSFGEEKEFNMIPAPRFTRLKGHKYQKQGIELLKMASLYGANGAGKSNLLHALSFLRKIVVSSLIVSGVGKGRSWRSVVKNHAERMLHTEYRLFSENAL